MSTEFPGTLQAYPQSSLIPFTVTTTSRRIDPPLKINDQLVRVMQLPEITEYLDLDTGEIIPAATVHQQTGRPIDASLRLLQRESILYSLRNEVLKFALYVLAFRNKRSGITPGIEKLVNWYAEATNSRPHHVRRHVPKLKKAGILAGESVLCPLFQRSGKKIQARDHLSEDCIASSTRMKKHLKLNTKDI